AGHSLEADVRASGTSGIYEGLRVGPEWLHVVDDALQLHAPGGYQQDDEATPAGRTTLIREGVIVSSLYDRYNAAQQGETSTGNGRRASFRDLPLPRISNLIMNEGSDSLADLLGRMG